MNGFFVAVEFALVSADRRKIEQLAKEGEKRARRAFEALRRLSFELSGAQLGITITSLLVGFIAEPTIGAAMEPLISRVDFIPESSTYGVSIAIALIIATATQMVVGELIPQNLGIVRPLGLTLTLTAPLRLFNLLFRPLIVFLNASANWTVRRFGIEPRDELTSVHSLEELQVLIQSSRQEGTLAEEEFSLLARSISFTEKTAADALIPRVAVVALGQDATVAEMAELALETGHSRFPVYGTDLDDILGVVHLREQYRIPAAERATTRVTELMQEALVVPEARNLAGLLLEMRRGRTQLAVVVDEYGGTAGIITLEDMLEEIVGEIEDEHDPAIGTPHLTTPLAGAHVVSGMLHRDEVLELTGFEMPDGDYETLAG
ncbi:MAG: magnesium and cobalt exporter, family, partial [Actinomycetota bacterium]|nr:magnesium and cobalt exporter, family [Actinomycetota bacterium]